MNNQTDSSGYIGHKPKQGQSVYSGNSGSVNPTNILQQVESIINKFNNRFILNDYKIDNKTMMPLLILTDNFTLKEHQFNTISMINLPIDFESFLNNIIIVERDTKIDNLLQ